jgi:hypothetical protein
MDEETKIIIAAETGVRVLSFDDISAALSSSFGSQGLILTEKDLSPEFFDLRTGLAGEFFQKFINYNLRVAIVLSDTKAYGERFSELAYEHATHNSIRIVRTTDEAKAWLSDQ